MKRIFCTMVMLLMLICQTAFAADFGKLVILHTNDTHGFDKYGNGSNGMAVIAQVKKDYEAKGFGVLLLDAGDAIQDNNLVNFSKGRSAVEFMNAAGYDAATLGNHEFDNGQADLARRLKKAKHKVVCCNYDFSKSPLAKYVKPYVIVHRGGLKIGIIGTTSYLEGAVMASNTEGLTRLDGVKEVNRWADYLKNRKHCGLVILLSHFGYSGGGYDRPSDCFMVANSRNLDLVIGGHSHTYLARAKETADLDGRIVPITQSSSKGVVVGTWEITLSRP